jgi:hypothetical protein
LRRTAATRHKIKTLFSSGSRWFLVVFALATSAFAAEPKMAVQVHLCELPAEAKMPNDMRQVLKLKGVDP